MRANLIFLLIDTGCPNQRIKLEQEHIKADCNPLNLKLIVLTHGDFGHIGNAAFLLHKFNIPVAMHKDVLKMAEDGDMFVNRKQPNYIVQKINSTLL